MIYCYYQKTEDRIYEKEDPMAAISGVCHFCPDGRRRRPSAGGLSGACFRGGRGIGQGTAGNRAAVRGHLCICFFADADP